MKLSAPAGASSTVTFQRNRVRNAHAPPRQPEPLEAFTRTGNHTLLDGGLIAVSVTVQCIATPMPVGAAEQGGAAMRTLLGISKA